MFEKIKNKKQRWVDYPNRLLDALQSNVHSNNINGLIENISYLSTSDSKYLVKLNNLLRSAIENSSKECAEYLISLGALPITTSSFITYNINILISCKYDKIIEVHDLILYLTDKYPDIFPKFDIDKKIIINRLISVSKVEANQKRVDYLLSNTHFFNMCDIEKCIDELYHSKPEKKSILISILRDIRLSKLGI